LRDWKPSPGMPIRIVARVRSRGLPARASPIQPIRFRCNGSIPAIGCTPRNSHDALDRDEAVQEEVRNVARAVVSAVQQLRAGTLAQPDAELRAPRPK
jgi:hypothetical protein